MSSLERAQSELIDSLEKQLEELKKDNALMKLEILLKDKNIAEWEELMEISYAELTVTRNQLDNANEKLRGSRQHRIEVDNNG